MQRILKIWPSLFSLSLLVLPACSDTDQPQNPPANAAAASSAPSTEALPPDEVAAIFNALDQKDTAKAGQLLKDNPKLIAAISDNGWPLLTVAAKNGDKPMVELLLNAGADVNAKNYSNEVALMYAALYGHKEIVELLLAKNADVNVKNAAGATPLTAATSSNHQDIADLLRQHGAHE
jgi:ankyrin repeat protein